MEGLGWQCLLLSKVMKPCWEHNEHMSLSGRFLQSPGKGGGVSETVSLGPGRQPVIPHFLEQERRARPCPIMMPGSKVK